VIAPTEVRDALLAGLIRADNRRTTGPVEPIRRHTGYLP
jgi:hypothetical protein